MEILRPWGERMKRSSAFLLFFFLALAVPAWAGEVVEEIIARVNNDIVSGSELERQKKQLRTELAQQYSGTELDRQYGEREKDLLRDLIDQSLLVQRAKDLGLSAETEVVKRLDRIRQDLKLATMEDLEKEVQRQGLAFEDFKNNIRSGILTQMAISREVGQKIMITREEVRQYYEQHKKEMEQPEQVHLREILISTEGKEESQIPELDKKAREVLALAKKGDDFPELARKYSDGPTAKEGGDIGTFERGRMSKELADVVFRMKTGEVSDVIRTRHGFLILKVEEHNDAGIPPLDKVEPRINEILYYQRVQPNLRIYLTRLREESYIDIRPGFVDTGASAKQSGFIMKADEGQQEQAKKKKKRKRFIIL